MTSTPIDPDPTDFGEVLKELTKVCNARIISATQAIALENATLTQQVKDLSDAIIHKTKELSESTYDLEMASEKIAALELIITDLRAQLGHGNPDDDGPIYMGMRCRPQDWDTQTAFLGEVEMQRVYQSGFDVASLMGKIKACKDSGYAPYASFKLAPYRWPEVLAGAADKEIDALSEQLTDINYELRLTADHEPFGPGINGTGTSGEVDTPAKLAVHAQALTYLFDRLRARGVGSNIVLGPTMNGHHWGLKWGTWTDEQLATVFTQRALDSFDVVGADFYDGATSLTNGEPAWVKAEQMALWLGRRNYIGQLDIGEWNFVKPDDCIKMWDTLVAYGYRRAVLFNSPENNRTQIPTPSGKWTLDPNDGTGRAQAFRSILDKAGIPGRN